MIALCWAGVLAPEWISRRWIDDFFSLSWSLHSFLFAFFYLPFPYFASCSVFYNLFFLIYFIFLLSSFLFILHINVLLFLHLIPLSFVFGVSIIPASTFIYLACLHVFFSLLYFLPHLSFPIFHLFAFVSPLWIVFLSFIFLLYPNQCFPSFHFCLFCFLFPSATFFPSFPSSFLLSHRWSFFHFFPSSAVFVLFAWDFAVVCLLLWRLVVRYQATTNTHQTLHTLSFPAGCKNRKPIKSDSFMSEH